MDRAEAHIVYSHVVLDTDTQVRSRVHQLGNGEYVIIVNESFYIWNMEEWDRYGRMWARTSARKVVEISKRTRKKKHLN